MAKAKFDVEVDKRIQLAKHIMRRTQDGQWLVEQLIELIESQDKNLVNATKLLLEYSIGKPAENVNINMTAEHQHQMRLRELSDSDLAQMEAIYTGAPDSGVKKEPSPEEVEAPKKKTASETANNGSLRERLRKMGPSSRS